VILKFRLDPISEISPFLDFGGLAWNRLFTPTVGDLEAWHQNRPNPKTYY